MLLEFVLLRQEKAERESPHWVYRCFVCGEGNDRGGGNALVFVRTLYDTMEPVHDVGKGIKSSTLSSWGVKQYAGSMYVPGYAPNGKLGQLYKVGNGLIPIPSLKHKIHGMNLFVGKKPKVIICEGPWDAMGCGKLWQRAKDATLPPTSNVKASLLSDTNVIAVPGCNVWKDEWNSVVKNKEVTLMFDSDHPNKRSRSRLGSKG